MLNAGTIPSLLLRLGERTKRSRRRLRHVATRIKHRWMPNSAWAFVAPFFVLTGLLLFTALRLMGRIRIEHKERIPHHIRGMAILSNHPSFLEAYLLPFIFGWRSLWLSLFPWSTPDQNNFSGRWWSFAKPRFIPVPRNDRNSKSVAKAFAKVNRLLRDGYRVVIFVEGGRTKTGLRKGKPLAFDFGNGVRMLKFGKGAARAIYKTQVPALLIFVQGSDMMCPGRLPSLKDLFTKVVVITIGPTVEFRKEEMKDWGTRQQVLIRMTDSLRQKFEELAREVASRKPRYYGFSWDRGEASK